MNSKLFIDASNLNVLFMVDDKFCLSANYSSSPERLAVDAQALGSSFDVYISLLPRQPGEGDVIVTGLNAGKIKFWALKAEIRTICNAIQNIPGVSSIFICNALACFLRYSRVENFQTILRYGQRYALITVSNRLPEEVKIYKGPKEVYEDKGDDFSCYGDIDLVDADKIRAKYPELSKLMRTTIVPLTSLIACDNTEYKLSMEEVNMQIARYIPEEAKTEVIEEAPPVEETIEEVVEEPVKQPREKLDWITALLVACICLCCMAIGYGYQFRDVSDTAQSYIDSLGPYETEIEYYRSIKGIYDNSVGLSEKFADLVDYAKHSELDITIETMNGYTDRVVLQFNCKSSDIKDQFSYYMERRYTVSGVNQYGSVNNTDGTITSVYGITLLI